MKKIIFVKPVWMFLSGDQAFVPDRVAQHLTGTGYAYTSGKEPPPEPDARPEQEPIDRPEPEQEDVPPPMLPEPEAKKLTTRKRHGKR